MRTLPAWIVGLTLIAIAVVKLPAYEKPNALQGAVHHVSLAALLLFWAHRRLRRKPALPRGRRLALEDLPEFLLVAYAVVCVLSPFWAEHPWLAVLGGSSIAVNCLWALILGQMLADAEAPGALPPEPDPAGRRAQDALWPGLVLIALVPLALGAAAVWDRWHFSETWMAQRQGHRNMLACFLLLPLFCSAGALGMRPRRAVACVLALALLLGLWLVALTGSTGAWVGIAAGAALFAATFLDPRRRRLLFVALLLLAGVGLAALYVSLQHGSALRNAILRTQQATRLLHVEGSLAMVARRPLLGWGAGNFMSQFSDFKPAEGILLGWAGNVTLHPHNELALVAVETGVLGLLLYVSAIVAVVARAYSAADRVGRARRRWAIAACLGACGAGFIHGLFTISLRYWGPMAAHWTALGLLLALSRAPEAPAAAPSPLSRKVGQIGAVLALGAAALLLAVVTLPGQYAHYLMGKAEDMERQEGHVDETLALYRRVPLYSRYVPQYIDAHVRVARLLQEAGRRDAAIAAFEKVEALAPGLGPARLLLGRMYLHRFEELGRPDDARRAAQMLRKYVRQRPDLAYARRYYAQALLAESPGDHVAAGSAVEQLRRAVALAPGDAASRDLLGRALMELGRYAEAENSFGSVVALAWRPLAALALGPPVGTGPRGDSSPLRRRAARALLNWARAAAAQGKTGDARARLRLALCCAPDWPELLRDARRIDGTISPPR